MSACRRKQSMPAYSRFKRTGTVRLSNGGKLPALLLHPRKEVGAANEKENKVG